MQTVYVIHEREVEDGLKLGEDEITKSELKRRLAHIIGWPEEELGDCEHEIGVLLHGVKW